MRGTSTLTDTTTPTPTNFTPPEFSWLKKELDDIRKVCGVKKSSVATITKRKIYSSYTDDGEVNHGEVNIRQLKADITLAYAKVLAVLKMMSLLVWSRHVGPMQISLGRTMLDIGKFMIIFVFVWFAFSLGMNQIYWFYEKEVFGAIGFKSLLDSLMSLFWALFGVSEQTIFAGHSSYYTETKIAGMGMYSLYHVFAIVILLNLLIAMMSNTYTKIEEDADIEWKYARSQLWMEYFDDSITVPPPFNLLPRPSVCYKHIKCILGFPCSETINRTRFSRAKSQFWIHYQKLLSKIGRRYHFDSKEDDKETGTVMVQAVANFKNDMVGALRKINNNILDVQSILGNGGNKADELDGKLVKSMKLTTSDSIDSVRSGCEEAAMAKLPSQYGFSFVNVDEDELIMPVRTKKKTTDPTAPDNENHHLVNNTISDRVDFIDD